MADQIKMMKAIADVLGFYAGHDMRMGLSGAESKAMVAREALLPIIEAMEKKESDHAN